MKLIGDEVMFVADDVGNGCEIALRLVEAFRNDDVLPPIRGGLSWGETISQEGDYFGPSVNLATRATKLAQAESVLVPESLTQEVSDARHFRFEQVGRRPPEGVRRAGDALRSHAP